MRPFFLFPVYFIFFYGFFLISAKREDVRGFLFYKWVAEAQGNLAKVMKTAVLYKITSESPDY